MRRIPASFVWLVAAGSCVLGAIGTSVMHPADDRGAARATAAPLATTLASSTRVPPALAPDWSDPAMFARQQREALGDPATRRQLMDDYLAETEGEKKQQALLVLSMLHTQDVLDFASELARSTDGARRRDGFALLARLGLKLPEVRRLARDALRSEQDPAVIAQAIGALQPALVERSESEAVAAQLRGFVDDRDAGVRARAIDAFAAWDQSGASAEVLDRGVLDPSPDVRWAAITAVGKFRARSEALKQSLIALAYDANEQSDLRLAAARALEHFPLDPDEVERLVRAAIDADRAAYPEAANRFDDRPRG